MYLIRVFLIILIAVFSKLAVALEEEYFYDEICICELTTKPRFASGVIMALQRVIAVNKSGENLNLFKVYVSRKSKPLKRGYRYSISYVKDKVNGILGDMSSVNENGLLIISSKEVGLCDL